MKESTKNKILQLAKFLSYPEQDLSLLILALTHRSKGEPNNERLEFLGDSVLNFIIGSELYSLLPEADEGTLTRLRAQLVKKETLIELAMTINLGDYLLLGPGEQKTGGHQCGSILADAFEAIIGCVFCSLGFIATKTLVLEYYQEKLKLITAEQAIKDPKTKLQEYLQAKKLQLPEYEVKEIFGAQHQQTFHVTCKVCLLREPVLGVGLTRRAAEQDAAAKIMGQLIETRRFE